MPNKQKAPFRIHDIAGDLQELGGGLKLLREGTQMNIDSFYDGVAFQNAVRVLVDEHLQTINRTLEALNESYADVQCKLIRLD